MDGVCKLNCKWIILLLKFVIVLVWVCLVLWKLFGEVLYVNCMDVVFEKCVIIVGKIIVKVFLERWRFVVWLGRYYRNLYVLK